MLPCSAFHEFESSSSINNSIVVGGVREVTSVILLRQQAKNLQSYEAEARNLI